MFPSMTFHIFLYPPVSLTFENCELYLQLSAVSPPLTVDVECVRLRTRMHSNLKVRRLSTNYDYYFRRSAQL